MSDPSPTAPEHRALALDYLARRRRGERPDVATFLAGHAAIAPLLRPLLEALRAPDAAPTDAEFEAAYSKFVESELAMTIGDATAPEERGRFDERYRVLRTIGQGGFGKVFLVEDELHPGEKLALKTIRVDRAADPQFEQRFRNEIRIMRALQHPGIPQIFNDGRSGDGEFFFTMAFLEGRTLEEVLSAGRLPLERTLRLVRQMVAILEYAHARNVVHRDLKPANVFVVDPGGADEQVKILDFGIAKVLRREGALNAMESMNTLGSPGTPAYMAPEQMLGEEIDARTDVYALGVILHRMLTGTLPFSGTTPETRLRARLTGTLPPLTAEQAPPWLAALVSRLLAPDRAARPALPEIARSLESQTFAAGPAGPKGRGRRPLVVAGLVVAAGAAAAILWPKGDGARHDDGERPAASGDPAGRQAAPDSPADHAAPAPATPSDPTPLAIAFDPEPPRLTREATLVLSGRIAGTAGGDACVLTLGGTPVAVGADGRFTATAALANEGRNELRFELVDAARKKTPFASSVPCVRDSTQPRLSLTAPAEGAAATRAERIELAGRVVDENPGTLTVSCTARPEPQPVACAADGSFRASVELVVGSNEFTLRATDGAGNAAPPLTRTQARRDAPPTLLHVEPVDGATIARDQEKVRVKFEADKEVATVEICGRALAVGGRSFDQEVALPPGDSPTLTLRALDRDGQAGDTKTIRLKTAELRAPRGFEAAAGAAAGFAGYAREIVHPATRLEFVLVEPSARSSAATKPFYVGRYEVTHEQFERFCQTSGRTPPKADAAIGAGRPGTPVVSLSIEEAEAFCAALAADGTARLPTTTEWELAAGGPERTLYPWGADWKPGRCNSGDEASEKEQRAVAGRFKELAAVGAFRDDVAPCGASDLAGNVSEWCRDEQGGAAVRGGSFLKDAKGCRLGEKGNALSKRSMSLGFRVVVALDR